MSLAPLTEKDVALANQIGMETTKNRIIQSLYRATGSKAELLDAAEVPGAEEYVSRARALHTQLLSWDARAPLPKPSFKELEGLQPKGADEQFIAKGAMVYAKICAGCHQNAGGGSAAGPPGIGSWRIRGLVQAAAQGMVAGHWMPHDACRGQACRKDPVRATSASLSAARWSRRSSAR